MLRKRIISASMAFLMSITFSVFADIEEEKNPNVKIFDFEEYSEGEVFKSGNGWNVSIGNGDSFVIETDPVSQSKALKMTKGSGTNTAFAEYTDNTVTDGRVEISYDVRIASATKYFKMIGSVKNSKWRGFTPEIKQSGMFDSSKSYSADNGWIFDYEKSIGYEYASCKHILDFDSGIGEFQVYINGKAVKNVTYDLYGNAGEYKYLGFAAETDNRFHVNAWDAVYTESDRSMTAENNPDGVMYVDNIMIEKSEPKFVGADTDKRKNVKTTEFITAEFNQRMKPDKAYVEIYENGILLNNESYSLINEGNKIKAEYDLKPSAKYDVKFLKGMSAESGGSILRDIEWSFVTESVISECDFENDGNDNFLFNLKDFANTEIKTDEKSGSKALRIEFLGKQNGNSSNLKYRFPQTDTGKIEADFDIRFENNSGNFSSMGNLLSTQNASAAGLRQVTDSFWKDKNTWLFVIGNDNYFHIKQIFNFETREYSFEISQNGEILKSFYDINENERFSELYALDFNVCNTATINGPDEGNGIYWIDNITVKQAAPKKISDSGKTLSPYEQNYSVYYDLPVTGTKSDITVYRNGKILDDGSYEVYFEEENKRVRIEFSKDYNFYDSDYSIFISDNIKGINGVYCDEVNTEFHVGAYTDVEIMGIYDKTGRKIHHIADAAGENVTVEIRCTDVYGKGFSGFIALKDNNGKLYNIMMADGNVTNIAAQIPQRAENDWYMELYAIDRETMKPYMLKKCVFNDRIVYVEQGVESGDGSYDFPYSSIEEAVSMVNSDTTVIIKDKTYRIASPIEIKNDGGYNIQITSLDKTVIDTRIHLDKYRKTNISEQSRLKNSDNIRVYELRDYGVDSISKLVPFGQSNKLSVLSEQVYCNGIPMTLAKYPNEGTLMIRNVYNNDGQSGELFKYSGADTSLWQDKNDIWMFGYPIYSWAHEFVKLKSVTDTEINADTAGKGQYRWGQNFCIVNVFEELDTQGEYYIDRENLILYVYPNSENDEISVDIYKDELVKLEKTSDISFRNIDFAGTRGNMVNLDSCENIDFINCLFTDGGVSCITMNNCNSCDVQGCEISYIGGRCIDVKGLDRNTMEKSMNRIVNNKIHDFAYCETTYSPAVAVDSIGNLISHNEIYNSNHMAISAYGNFNVYEYNYIHDVLQDVTDSGAIYTGRTWTSGGNVIRYNHFKDFSQSTNTLSNNAIYFDDAMFGTEVYGNIFEDLQTGVFVHGGRCNIIWNNIFINVDKPVEVKHIYSNDEIGGIRANAYTALMNLKFKESFPELVRVIDDEPTEPKYNKAYKNVLIRSGDILFDESALATAEIYDNVTADTDIFIDGYTVDEESYLFEMIPDFEIIDSEYIGNI